MVILIVDDEFGITESLSDILSSRGHTVLAAINGRAALEEMAQNRPDFVLSDVMMPIMNGVELLRAIKRDPATADIPIALMSAAPERAIPEDARAAMEWFLEKPFGAEEVIARIEGRVALHS